MTIHCNATPCPIILSAECVHYEGASLIYSGINTNDTLEVVIVKLDNLIHNSGTVETDPIFTAWNKSTGISITESQISDLQAYITDISGEDLSTADNSTSQFITLNDITEYATKKTGTDAGYLGQRAFDDDYSYICTIAGIAGVAVWKKSVLFNT